MLWSVRQRRRPACLFFLFEAISRWRGMLSADALLIAGTVSYIALASSALQPQYRSHATVGGLTVDLICPLHSPLAAESAESGLVSGQLTDSEFKSEEGQEMIVDSERNVERKDKRPEIRDPKRRKQDTDFTETAAPGLTRQFDPAR
jgi:hypothetical protein